ncbi:zinc ribbon domain-containing protein [Chloroflexota bacterium]
MPIYEYVCPGCELKFEKLRSLSQSDEAIPCPRCEKMARRIMSRFACVSRGEGGVTSPIGGSSCSSCGSSSCSSCGM